MEIVIRVRGYGGIKAFRIGEGKLIVKEQALFQLLNKISNALNTKVVVEEIII